MGLVSRWYRPGRAAASGEGSLGDEPEPRPEPRDDVRRCADPAGLAVAEGGDGFSECAEEGWRESGVRVERTGLVSARARRVEVEGSFSAVTAESAPAGPARSLARPAVKGHIASGPPSEGVTSYAGSAGSKVNESYRERSGGRTALEGRRNGSSIQNVEPTPFLEMTPSRPRERRTM